MEDWTLWEGNRDAGQIEELLCDQWLVSELPAPILSSLSPADVSSASYLVLPPPHVLLFLHDPWPLYCGLCG